MSLYTASLNSGSNGNCYYVANGKDAVLIDAGISCKETEKRLRRLGLSVLNIRAIFISHEHIDHIKGVEVLSAKYNIPVYITAKTLQYSRLQLNSSLVRVLENDKPIEVGGMTVRAFSKLHDAIEPNSFIVEGNGVTVGIFTDIGNVCDNLVGHFRKCHAAFLEANYDEGLLEKGRYPIYLKNRIRGGSGHLSNKQALELFKEHKPVHMSHLFLSHLSKENNSPQIAYDLFNANSQGVNIVVASRYEQTELFHIKTQITTISTNLTTQKLKQASLF